MRFVALLAGILLCGCQPVQTQIQPPLAVTAQPRKWTEARAYLAEVRASLNVAYLRDRETTALGDCDSPRFEDVKPPRSLEACRLSIASSTDYRIEARFMDGLTWIADKDGIRQAEAEPLQMLR